MRRTLQSYPQTVIDIWVTFPSVQLNGTDLVEHRGPNIAHPLAANTPDWSDVTRIAA